MRALLFLYLRSFLNGVKRAFSSPTRTLGVLFFIGVNLWWLPRAFFTGSTPGLEELARMGHKLQLPPLAVIDAGVFGIYCTVTMIFVLSLFNHRAVFRAADVDVLFPTPVSPKTVLTFKVMRDISLTLVMPLFMAVILWRPVKIGWASLFSNVQNPAIANSALRVALVAYFLSAIAWVWLGHASSLVLSKPDVKTDRIRSVLAWALALGFLGFVATVGLRARQGEFPDNLVQIARSFDVRSVFFMASAATSLTMSTLNDSWIQAAIGGGSLLLVIVIAVTVARHQTAWLYEQAALRTNVTEATRQLRRSGDMMAIAVQRAQSGRLKAGKSGWLQRVTVKGPYALVWKEAIVTRRSNMTTTVLFAVMSFALSYVACLFPSQRLGNEFGGVFLLIFQSMIMLGPAMGFAQAGFIESLRRIDLLKPIPFASQTIVFFEVVCKAAGTWLAVAVGMLTAIVLKPALWQYAVGGLILFPSLTLALSAVSLLLVLLLPDFEDPTQRGFRGLATMLGMLAVSGPPVALFAGLIWIKVPVVLAALPTALIMIGLAWVATTMAGRVYEDFNPAD